MKDLERYIYWLLILKRLNREMPARIPNGKPKPLERRK